MQITSSRCATKHPISAKRPSHPVRTALAEALVCDRARTHLLCITSILTPAWVLVDPLRPDLPHADEVATLRAGDMAAELHMEVPADHPPVDVVPRWVRCVVRPVPWDEAASVAPRQLATLGGPCHPPKRARMTTIAALLRAIKCVNRHLVQLAWPCLLVRAPLDKPSK